jgi:nucleoside-diphosphate-sugar epimerase
MKIFITGASGFIGGTVARRLIGAGHTVRGLVRDAVKAERLRALGVEPVLGDLDDRAVLIREAGNADGVINLADSDHLGAIQAFIDGLRNSGKPLLHTSGSSVIADDARGNQLTPNIYDETTPFLVEPMKQPRRQIELDILAAADTGVRTVVLCPSNIYGTGSGLTPQSFQIPYLLDRARETGVVRIVGMGVNRWSNVHVDDVADLYLLALEHAPAGSYYFIENGEASFGEIGAALARRLAYGEVQSWSADEAARHWGEMHARYTFGSNSRVRARRAREELGWAPRHASVIDWIDTEMPL